MRNGKIWLAIDITVDAKASEAIEFALNELDTLGTEISSFDLKEADTAVVIGYFTEKPDKVILQDQLAEALRIYGFSIEVVRKIEWREVEDKDWLAEWKKHWKPTHIGRFVIAAPWHEVDDPDKIVIRIEPNMAFGTGTHETTQLCLAAISEIFKPGQSFLDVGTGTGILAVAVAKFDVKFQISDSRFSACDTDEDSIKIARENSALNGVRNIDFFAGSITKETPQFDFVCANLTADVIIPIFSLLLEKTGSTLVMSGILAEQEESVLAALPPEFAGKHLTRHLGEWISITVSVG